MPGLAVTIKIIILFALLGLFTIGFISGCSTPSDESNERVIEDPIVPLAQFDPVFAIPEPVFSGIHTEINERAVIDHSNKHDGYVIVKMLDDLVNNMRVLITSPCGREYIYDISADKQEVFPLSKGNGLYTIGVFEHVENDIYTQILLASIDVDLKDEFAPFIRPNRYVDYNKDSMIVKKAAELTKEIDCFFAAVEAIFLFVVDHVEYDYEFANVVEFDYLPDLDDVLEQGKGICFDMAALTVAMLRSQGIPTKLIMGDYDDDLLDYSYHAWVSVFSKENGWIANWISFHGDTWNILDPTLASRAGLDIASQAINNDSEYKAMFVY